MEVGTEISQKIRSAIKAKLMELGSYVDDELPDYIMVMVANKKSRDQMSSDLGLFLGANTDTFTGWLQELLTKLQKINENEPGRPLKSGKTKEKKKDKGKKKDKQEKQKKKSEKPAEERSVATVEPEQVDTVKQQVEEKSKDSHATQVSHDGPNNNIGKSVKAGSTSSAAVIEEDVDEVEDVRQLLVTEEPSDDLARELQTESPNVATVVSAVTREKSGGLPHQTSASETDEIPGRSKSSSPERSVVKSRKRKAPTSVVSSVNRVEEDEEEYDPYNPAVGNVASVVKVTKRKSSVPPALQANRSLLMKAMTEAEHSIAVKRKIGVTRPMSRDESPAETYSPKRRCSEGAEHEETPPPYIPSKKENSPRSQTTAKVLKDKGKLSQHDARHMLNKEERKELIARSRRHELLRTIGIDRDESEKPLKTVALRREVKKEGRCEVENFTITTKIVPVKSAENLAVEERQRKRSVSPPRRHSAPQTKKSKGPISSRLGKVVVERSPSPPPVIQKRVENRTSVVQARKRGKDAGERLTLSRLGKDLVKKQCAAAVLSVTAPRRVADSRVVHCDDKGDRRDRSRSTSTDRPVEKLARPSEKLAPRRKEERDPSPKSVEDAEDLAEMLKDSGSEALEDLHADEFTLDLEEEDLSQVLEREADEARQQEQNSGQGTSGKKGTRFIVTLDGVDENKFDDQEPGPSYRGEQVYAAGSQLLPPQAPLPMMGQPPTKQYAPTGPVLPTLAVPARMTPPKIQPFSISLKDSDDEHEGKLDPLIPESQALRYQQPGETFGESSMGLTALQKAKQNERCKFWPACVAGSQCEYHHPTVHCKTFPNCKFGDKCLFIHPNCRFDSKCMRPDCPYTHTSKRSTPAVVAIPQSQLVAVAPPKPSFRPTNQSTVICRFFPNCLNASCPYAHPKPCRFGAACMAKGCPFYHPTAPPSKDKLKWQAQPAIAKVKAVPVLKPA